MNEYILTIPASAAGIRLSVWLAKNGYPITADCGGKGKTIKEKCPDCKGRGYVTKDAEVTIDIPAGADTGSYTKMRGLGHAPSGGGEPGDLIVAFRVEGHKIFTRDGFDLHVDLPISFKTAALGGVVRVPTIDETIEFTVPEGTQSGQTFNCPLAGGGGGEDSDDGNVFGCACVIYGQGGDGRAKDANCRCYVGGAGNENGKPYNWQN